MTDRLDLINKLYRGNISYNGNFTDNKLEFQALSWEKEDIASDSESDDDSDDDFEVKKKKYKQRKLVIRTYGLTKNGISICLEIKDFKPYFLLKIPSFWNLEMINKLKNRISIIVKYRKKDISFSIVKMKKLYYFDNYKDHKFLKISFISDSARWDVMKLLIPNERVAIRPDIIKFQKTIHMKIKGIVISLDVYESRMDTIIRFIHLSKIKPSGIISIDKKHLNYTKTKTKCQITKSVSWDKVIPVNDEWIAPFRTASYDIECTSKDGSFPRFSRKEDKIIQIGTTTRIYGKNCMVQHIITLKDCDNIPDVKHQNGIEFVIVESAKTERIINSWAKHICSLDPDVMIGYNIFGFTGNIYMTELNY